MWSGLLPSGITESEISEDEDVQEEAVSSLVAPDAVSVPDIAETVQGRAACPAGVPIDYWNKFLDLQKKRSDLKIAPAPKERRKRRRKGRKMHKQTVDLEKKTSSPSVKIAALDTLQQYFGINERFEPAVGNKILKKSRLEDSIDQAVDKGDIKEAEELSDKLATREMAVKITKAVSCHKYLRAKEEQDASEESQKKTKNLAWGFEAKQRWETKSNMGYM